VRATRTISRRSFLGRVAGASALALAGCATPRREVNTYDPLEDAAPRERGGLAATRCSDTDAARHPPGDRHDEGRNCNNSGRGRPRHGQ
jgi:hypothetical protein